MTDKAELRASMRSRRKDLAERDPKAADRVAGHADDLPDAPLHAVYYRIGSELDPAPLVNRLAGAGQPLCLPVVVDLHAPMVFRRWWPGQPLEPDLTGVPAPLPLAEAVTPGLILTPLLAFDGAGGRLGQGGGYYDRTFAALPQAIRIGLAFAGQEVDLLPLEPHDIRLHGVLTERGYRAFA